MWHLDDKWEGELKSEHWTWEEEAIAVFESFSDVFRS